MRKMAAMLAAVAMLMAALSGTAFAKMLEGDDGNIGPHRHGQGRCP